LRHPGVDRLHLVDASILPEILKQIGSSAATMPCW
jgi:hypothetical protein